MGRLQEKIVEEMGVQPEINSLVEVENRVKFLVDYTKKMGTQGFVLGISGGVDSCLAGFIAQQAATRLREQGVETYFYAMKLPYNEQRDEESVVESLDFIQPDEVHNFNIESTVDEMEAVFNDSSIGELSDYHKGNVKARLRMVVQYALAGSKNSLVVGTDHAAESITGFFTKFGDGGADILPNFSLNKRQIRKILQELGAPDSIYNKAATADLLDNNPGQLDEDELGLTYDDIDDYLEGKVIDSKLSEKLEQRYLETLHKRTVPVTILDSWWNND